MIIFEKQALFSRPLNDAFNGIIKFKNCLYIHKNWIVQIEKLTVHQNYYNYVNAILVFIMNTANCQIISKSTNYCGFLFTGLKDGKIETYQLSF
jgi:hypothetical protein